MAQFIIGDIHGHFDQFQKLLKAVGFSSQDYLISLGDLINRGTQSLETVLWFYQHREQSDWLMGNHDFYLLCILEQAVPPREFPHPLQDIAVHPLADELRKYMRQRPLALRLKCNELEVYCTHAGFHPHFSPEESLLASPKKPPNLSARLNLQTCQNSMATSLACLQKASQHLIGADFS